MRRHLLPVLCTALLLAVATACGSEAAPDASSDAPPAAEDAAAGLADGGAAQVEEVVVEDSGSDAEVEPAAGEPAEAVPLALAAVKTSEAGSARMAMSFSMGLPGAPGPVAMEIGGAFDFAGRKGWMEMDFSALLDAFAESFGDQAAQMSDAFPDLMVFDDLVMYMRFPQLGKLLPGAKPWVRMDLGELAAEQGLDLDSFAQFGQSDPSQLLAYLQAAAPDLEELGTEKVRGVETTHYHATIDLESAADYVPADLQGSVRESLDALVQQTGQSTMPMDVWVDADGLVRRVSSEFGLPGSTGSADAFGASWTMELYDFGVEVETKVPPAEKVMDFQDLMQLGVAA